MIKEIAKEYNELLKAKAEVERLQKTISEKLEEIKAQRGKTFHSGSKWYQIRKRGMLNYICSSEVPFASWLKKGNIVVKINEDLEKVS